MAVLTFLSDELAFLRDALDGRHDAVRTVATTVVVFSFVSTLALCAYDAFKHRRTS